jgi:hypothetical protein
MPMPLDAACMSILPALMPTPMHDSLTEFLGEFIIIVIVASCRELIGLIKSPLPAFICMHMLVVGSLGELTRPMLPALCAALTALLLKP